MTLFCDYFNIKNFAQNELSEKCVLVIFYAFWHNLTLTFGIFQIRLKMAILEFFEF